MNFLIIFIALSIINVVFSTIRSIVTIKGGAISASVISGGYFAFYNIMLLYTVADFPMWQKCVITFVCNVVGVFVVKMVEQKMRKDRLWKFEVTFHDEDREDISKMLKSKDIPFNYLPYIGTHCIFNIFCETSAQSAEVKKIIDFYNGKYFISKSKAC